MSRWQCHQTWLLLLLLMCNSAKHYFISTESRCIVTARSRDRLFHGHETTQLLNNYKNYDDEIYTVTWSNLSRCQSEKMNSLVSHRLLRYLTWTASPKRAKFLLFSFHFISFHYISTDKSRCIVTAHGDRYFMATKLRIYSTTTETTMTTIYTVT